jgi:uncharacterized protein YraI
MKRKYANAWMLRLTVLVVALVGAGWTRTAAAVTAVIATSVHLRAGPSIEYPSVAMLLRGQFVEVSGCEQDYNWCDVQVGADRGWVDAAYLQVPSASGPVPVATGGVTLGIAVVPFVLNTYWATYYVGRPWYARQPYYYSYWTRYPHGRPPPPPHYRPPYYRPPPPPPRPPYRPPAGGKPPGGKPPSGGKPPGGKPPSGKPPGGKPPPGNGSQRPPPSTRPAPQPSSGQ